MNGIILMTRLDACRNNICSELIYSLLIEYWILLTLAKVIYGHITFSICFIYIFNRQLIRC